MMITRLAFLVQVASTVSAFQAFQPSPTTARSVSSSTRLQVTPAEAIATLSTSQENIIRKIQTTISDLEAKDDFTWKGNDVVVDSSPVTLDARDAAGPSNVAWLSSLCVDSKMSALQVFNGPLNDVPHLVSRCVVLGGDKMRLTIDFRPRGYGAYEMRRPDGSYPGPDELGRKSFEYSGARSDYDKKFGTEEVKEFLSSFPLEGAVPCDIPPTELDLLTRGPLYTCIDMPLTEANVDVVVAAREKAAYYWLSWSQEPEHEHRPGAPINSQYVYDTKYKQNAFGALMSEYTAIFGADGGKQLAIGDSGPLDEAYVGGGS
uniref:Amine oxidase n=1 Tax=Pseudo-nitzschia australis TaxID=44445 RepID=A0A7S4A9K9_9STRA